MTAQKISAKAASILKGLGFDRTEVRKATTDKVVLVVKTPFPTLRKALSRTYGACDHNVAIPGGRRATWIMDGHGTLIAKSARKGEVQVTYATMPFIR